MRIRPRWGSYGALALIVLIASLSLAASTSAGGQTALSFSPAIDVDPKSAFYARALRGGVLATFDVHGELFRAWVTNPEAIDQLFALQQGVSTATIPIGRLRPGPGRAAHNAPWRWHFDPKRFALAEFTIEVCDATPSYVNENLIYFLRTVRSYCPWGAVLVGLQDFR